MISTVFAAALFCLAWWYLQTVPGAGSSLSSWESPHPSAPSPASSSSSTYKPASLRGDPLDFSLPLRFTDGLSQLKPPGSNYTYKIVVPKTEDEDIAWITEEIPDAPLVVYELDNPNAEHKVPKNKGREAMVYLSYIIDHYDDLADTTIFMHAHRYAWHNNMLQGLSTVTMIKRLNHERVARMGYMNLRCHHDPGCPDWIHLDRPGGDFDFYYKPEEIYWRRHIWEELHPGAPIPPSLSGICCAQFALSKQRIRDVPIERFLHYRKWLLTTPMEDQYSGRIFEYIWHYIFTGHEVFCPAMNTCYCDGYGICFGGRQKFDDYFTKQDNRNTMNEKLQHFKGQVEGQVVEPTQDVLAERQRLQETVDMMDKELDTLRDQAKRRGEDPKARQEETESWDSSHIWDYLPQDKAQ